mmetsp:Transcript_2306/g.4772  ORF Transcript_2306/g.4772 Transcript_2306/m.4772 type:complete len:119 (+) Transcript_2306:459-815(+)
MKFSAVIALSATSSAAAFAPASKSNIGSISSSSALRMLDIPSDDWKGYYTDYDDNQVIKTEADVGFDPLGFSDTEAGLFFMREAEIKHCRIALTRRTAIQSTLPATLALILLDSTQRM